MENLLELYRQEAATALSLLRRRVRWKPGKAVAHLEKRKFLGHLSAECSVAEYTALIQILVRMEEHRVYLYHFGAERYYAVRGIANGKDWLVIVTKKGMIETAFPPDAIDEYLRKRGFVLMGTIQEVGV